MKIIIFLVQSIVFLAMFSNLRKNVVFISYLADYIFSSEIECSTVTQEGRVIVYANQPVILPTLAHVLGGRGGGGCSFEDFS